MAVDTRATEGGDFELPIAGWTQGSGVDLFSLLRRYAEHSALRHILCTDIARDGMLGGPNQPLYQRLCVQFPQFAVQVSGGVRHADDVRGARDAGAAGAIVGKALLEGRVTLDQLLAC